MFLSLRHAPPSLSPFFPSPGFTFQWRCILSDPDGTEARKQCSFWTFPFCTSKAFQHCVRWLFCSANTAEWNETKVSCFICIKCHWSPMKAVSQSNDSQSNNLFFSAETYSQKPINGTTCWQMCDGTDYAAALVTWKRRVVYVICDYRKIQGN